MQPAGNVFNILLINMEYPKDNVMKYAYYERVENSMTLDEAGQLVGGLYTDHSSCHTEEATYIWNIFETDFKKNMDTFGSLYSSSGDYFESEGYKYKMAIYTVPRSGSVREKTIFFAGIQVRTETPQIPGTEFGYARIFRLACKFKFN